jgi:hypothetical protein
VHSNKVKNANGASEHAAATTSIYDSVFDLLPCDFNTHSLIFLSEIFYVALDEAE